MSGVLYLIALALVPWLVAWTIRDPAQPTELWWPFDMKGDETPVATQPGVEKPGNWRQRGANGASWRPAGKLPPANPGPRQRDAPPRDLLQPDQPGRAATRRSAVLPGLYRAGRSPSRPPSGPGMAR